MNTMRDDFIEEVKRTCSARVGNVCSNPDCRALTSGPQDDPTKVLNVGVAAHITSAAPGGPRYDPSLSAEARRHADNAIWLCQNCAKLVDNDPSQFPEKLLRAWKTVAEARALSTIGKTAQVSPESEAQRKLRAIFPWKGKRITLAQMSTGRAVMLIGPIRGLAEVTLVDCNEFVVTIGNDGSSRSISLKNVEVSLDNAANRLELQERYE
jgi:hypothetical protein